MQALADSKIPGSISEEKMSPSSEGCFVTMAADPCAAAPGRPGLTDISHPASHRWTSVQAEAAQRYLPPALLEMIRGTFFDFGQLEKIDAFLGHLDTGRAATRPAYLTPTLRMIAGIRLDSLSENALSDLFQLALGYLNLTDTVGVRLMGAEGWQAVAEDWSKAIAAMKTKVIAPDALPAEPASGVVVLAAIGNPGSETASRAQKQFAPITGRRLALHVPDHGKACAMLRAEFPYAVKLVDAVEADLSRGTGAALRNRLIAGPPGAGKTRFWVRLCETLGIPHIVYSCGGESDSAFAGAARQWSTGEAAVPVVLMAQHRIANPVIILDEIEKVGTGKHNGNLLDALLGMLGDTTAGSWRDPFLEAPVDLRHVNWLASANAIEEIPAPLRDRWTISKFLSPDASHAPHLIASLWPGVVAALGVDARFVPALGQDEIEAITRLWASARPSLVQAPGKPAETGLSVRRLKVIMERWLQRRDGSLPLH
jgi:hypothetical protein